MKDIMSKADKLLLPKVQGEELDILERLLDCYDSLLNVMLKYCKIAF
ncbi:hypothetical protein [Helicobacter monodelphidis]|nr:hypothetical protein [Helicobacter sp. 15-1451]